jgi:D-tyrosyl-tRNA(Tyr) deacylase
LRLRIFADAEGVMNRSLEEVGGEVLAVSQFTLFASTRKGNRPSWSRAAAPQAAEPLFARFVALLQERLGRPVATGVFGADMAVSLDNDGPVTLVLDSRQPE